MAENVGGIYWQVDADTSPAINSTKQFDAQVNQVENSLKSLDTRTTKTAKAVNSGMAGIGRSAGQAGIQLQQFIGQIQGGQSAMLALSQQSADLGFVLGAPLVGAIVGIGASVAGLLLPSLFDSKDATESLDEALESLSKVVKINSDGVNVLTNDYALLAKQSASLAQSQLLLARVNAKDVLIDSANAAEQAFMEFDTLFNAVKASTDSGTFSNLDSALERTGKTVTDLIDNTDLYATGLTQLKSATDQISEAFGTNTEQTVKILRAYTKFKEARTPEEFENLSNTLVDLAVSTKSATPEFIKFANTTANLALKSKSAAEQIAFLEKALNGEKVETESSIQSKEKYQSLLDSLTVSSQKLRSEQTKMRKQIALEEAERDGVSESLRNQIAAAFDKIIANDREAEALRELNKQNAEAAKIARDKAQAEREANRAAKEQSRNLGKFESLATSAITSAEDDPEVQLAMQRDEKLKELRQAYMDADLADTQQFVDASKAIWQSYNDDLEALSQARALNTLASFQSTFDALAGVFKNAQGEQSNAFRAMFAISKGFAVAQAGLNLSKAISDAYAWGGMTIPEKFASAAAIAAAGGQVISAIGSASYSGREHGGSVMAGVPYEVGEKNKPELLMIPGNNGKVFSNAEVKGMMGGGGGATEVNVYNYGNDQVTTNTSYNQLTRQDVIDIIIGQSNNPNSKMMRNVTRNTTSSNVAGAGKR